MERLILVLAKLAEQQPVFSVAASTTATSAQLF